MAGIKKKTKEHVSSGQHSGLMFPPCWSFHTQHPDCHHWFQPLCSQTLLSYNLALCTQGRVLQSLQGSKLICFYLLFLSLSLFRFSTAGLDSDTHANPPVKPIKFPKLVSDPLLPCTAVPTSVRAPADGDGWANGSLQSCLLRTTFHPTQTTPGAKCFIL